jgi:hypothetical protein
MKNDNKIQKKLMQIRLIFVLFKDFWQLFNACIQDVVKLNQSLRVGAFRPAFPALHNT